MTVSLALGLLVFGATYVAITLEKVHRTIVALAGAVLMLLLGLIPQEEAFARVDWNVIFLLAGMMIVANGIQRTGVFQWVAITLVKAARAEPKRVLVYLAGFAAAELPGNAVLPLFWYAHMGYISCCTHACVDSMF